MNDPHAITSVAQLIEVFGEPKPAIVAKVVPDLGPMERRFIAHCPLLLLATADGEGRVTVSPKGDGPGFVQARDARTIAIPERPGNKLAFGHRNILSNPRVGLLLLVPGTRETLRIDGTARLTRDPKLLEAFVVNGKPPLLVTEVAIERCFFHCGKAFIRSKLWQPEAWPTEDLGISGGAWAKERFGVDDTVASDIDAGIAEDAVKRLY